MCKQPSSTPGSTYCDEHTPLPSDRTPRARSTLSPNVADELEAQLETSLGMIGMLWGQRDPECANALVDAAPGIAKFWADQARSNARIAAALTTMMGGGGWMAGVIVHAPLVIQLVRHHVAEPMQRRQQSMLTGEAPVTFAGDPDAPYVDTGHRVDGIPIAEWLERNAPQEAESVGWPPDLPEPNTTTIADPAAEAAARAAAALEADDPEPWRP